MAEVRFVNFDPQRLIADCEAKDQGYSSAAAKQRLYDYAISPRQRMKDQRKAEKQARR